MRLTTVTFMIFASVSFSETITGTDWSGGGGVPGPVTDWGNRYHAADHINDTGGSLRLASAILSIPVEHTVDGEFNSASRVHAADIDGDGDTDILGAARDDDEITWWENTDGTGTVWTEHTVDGDFDYAISVYATDVDGDGDTDILGAAFIADDITWWENTDGTGTVWTEHTVDGDFDGAQSIYAADLDHDGDTDILGAAYGAGEISWWENMNGTGTVWTEHTVDGSFDLAHSVYAADVNGDGDTDILGASRFHNDITWWENTGGTSTVWTEHVVDDNFNHAHSVFATDVDGDGDTDVLGASIVADDITWWENTDGTGTMWREHTVDDSFGGAHSVYATDVDGDGDTDILGAAWTASCIMWWENTDGTGNLWTEHTVDDSFSIANSIFAADVDGDGDTDVLSAAFGAGDITWWDVMGYSPAGVLESSILDAGAINVWLLFTSHELEPAGTSVAFQFRSSALSTSMGTWSDTVFTDSTDLSGILPDFTNFVQYRVIMQTADPSKTPLLNDVIIAYTSELGIGNTDTGWDLEAAANPSFGSFAVQVTVPQSAMVDLHLYDVTGRVIAQHSQEMSSGEHSVSFNNLQEGVYFCTMRAEDFTATTRIVILN